MKIKTISPVRKVKAYLRDNAHHRLPFDTYLTYLLRLSSDPDALEATSEILLLFRGNEMSASVIIAFNDKSEMLEILSAEG